MNLTKFSINRPIGITMIVLFFVVLGLYSYWRIGVELLPALNTPYVSVNINYDGASAESVEQQVIKPVEDALASLSDVKHITSYASQGRARINIELEFYANADYAAIDATKKINAIRGRLPDGIDEPSVIKRDINDTPIMEIAVLSQEPLGEMYSRAENDFQDVILQAGGVSEVELHGGRDKEIAVEINKERLAYYNLTMDQVAQALRNENVLMPAGSVYTNTQQTNVRVTAQYANEQELSQIQVQNNDGVSIPLTAFAEVKRQEQRAKRYARVNGQDAINMSVYKNSNANIVTTADNVVEKIDQLQKDYPNYQFIVTSNNADYVRNALHNTLGTLIEGLITTGLTLFFFLRGWRSTAAVMIAIPTSLISTFFAMYMAGFTFNMMTLMGMALCVGILVDDSIVVLENIHRHMEMGEKSKDAALNGRMEIGMAAIAITLCDVVVFLPIAFMQGMTGQFFKQFGLTIVFATLFSLFVSFTLTPMLASRLYKNGLGISDWKLWKFADALERGAQDEYERVLKWSFGHKKKLFIGVTAAFFITASFIPLRLISSEFMPRTDEGGFNINVQLPTSASIERTDAVARELEQYVLSIPEVEYCSAFIGGRNANEARIKVSLVNRKDRDKDIWTITNAVRQYANENIRDGDVRVREDQASIAGNSGGNAGGGGAVRMVLRGNDMQQLIDTSYKVQDMMKNDIAGLKDISSSYTEGMPEYQLVMDREKMKYYGVSVSDLSKVLDSSIDGKTAGVLANDVLNNSNDTDIYLRFKASDGYRPADVEKIPMNVGNRTIFLGDVAKVQEGVGPVTITRMDKQRAIILGANTTDRALNDILTDINNTVPGIGLPKGITYTFTGQADQMSTTFMDMFGALALALILIYMILCVLYESVLTPFIRMFSLPFGLIGSLFLLFLTNNTINLYSLIGILVMDGLVAKNGTLLLDYTLTLKEQGMNAYDAIVEAGRVRLKPIFMTTMTMIVGMLPTALAVTEGAETRVGMALVIIGGLITSTVFTLLVIPIIYLFFEDHPVGTWLDKIRQRKNAVSADKIG